MQYMVDILLQLLAFALEPFSITFELVVQALDLVVSIGDQLLELVVLDLHQLDGLGVVVQNIIELDFVLPGVGLLYLLDLSTFADLQLVDIFVKLRDLVH